MMPLVYGLWNGIGLDWNVGLDCVEGQRGVVLEEMCVVECVCWPYRFIIIIDNAIL
jgi:hypothetical protein